MIDHRLVLDSAIETAAKTIERVDGDVRAVERFGSRAAEPLPALEATRRLDVRTRAIDPEGLIGAAEVAALLGVGSRQAVHARRERGQLLGFRNGRRDVHFPREPFDERGRVAPGLAAVLALFDGDAFEAWTWLSTASSALDEARPLDRLRGGDIDAVIAAATGYLQGDFG